MSSTFQQRARGPDAPYCSHLRLRSPTQELTGRDRCKLCPLNHITVVDSRGERECAPSSPYLENGRVGLVGCTLSVLFLLGLVLIGFG